MLVHASPRAADPCRAHPTERPTRSLDGALHWFGDLKQHRAPAGSAYLDSVSSLAAASPQCTTPRSTPLSETGADAGRGAHLEQGSGIARRVALVIRSVRSSGSFSRPAGTAAREAHWLGL
jgi:hypothetical protein